MSEKVWLSTEHLRKISKRIREKGTHQKASYPDKQLVAVADAFDEIIEEIENG